jgi:hypothetical protein
MAFKRAAGRSGGPFHLYPKKNRAIPAIRALTTLLTIDSFGGFLPLSSNFSDFRCQVIFLSV